MADNNIAELRKQLEALRNKNELTFKDIYDKLDQLFSMKGGKGGNVQMGNQLQLTNQKMLLNLREAIDNL